MTLLALVAPAASSVVGWAVVGLVPGFLAARVYQGGRHGPDGDTAVGLAGVAAAVGGGAFAWAVGPAGGMPFILTMAAAALAAAAVVLAIQWVGPQPRPAR